MMKRNYPGYCLLLALVLFGLAALPAGAQTYAPGDPVPRILVVGDSWAGFMQAMNGFGAVLPEYPGLGNTVQVGYTTAIMGAKTCEYVDDYLPLITESLDAHPTIDMVALSLSGNDFLRGSRNYPRWNPAMTAAEEDALIADIVADIADVLDHIMSVRPNSRVALYGYSFTGRERDDCTVERMNNAFLKMETAKKALVETYAQVFYVHNLGLMQWHFGTEAYECPEHGSMPAIPPETVPFPGNYPDYDPFPGGNLLYNAPDVALIDNDIHLTDQGYRIVARRILDEFAAAWLDAPRVTEILPLEGRADTVQFRVSFTEPVTGVDSTDFTVTADTGAPTVTEVNGTDAVYTITVDMAGATGTPVLAVTDDDSIVDGSGNPLGGSGAGNGDFSCNGAYDFEPNVPPEPGDFEGAAAFFDLVSTPYLAELNGFSFAPDQLDANAGDVDIEEVIIRGNTMLDVYEFGLINAAANTPGLDFTDRGGLSSQAAADTWDTNILQMQNDLGGVGGLAMTILPGIDTLMAGYMTLGNSDSVLLPLLLLGFLASQDDFPVNITPPSTSNYALHPEWFSEHGDADADGFRNRTEYHALGDSLTREAYSAAALDNAHVPLRRAPVREDLLFSFDAIDTDDSGVLTLAEAQAWMPLITAAHFTDWFDDDDDGSVSRDELLWRVARSLLDEFDMLDSTPADGDLTYTESRRRVWGLAQSTYNLLDTDGDNAVTNAELTAIIPAVEGEGEGEGEG
ncbi:MAG: hypothetical protein ACLFTT_16115, partial [Candidatus Hydrogenedentota bacterium]